MKVDTGPKIRRDRKGRERAILVGLDLPGAVRSYRQPLEELSQLADTAGADAIEFVVQKRESHDPTTFIGKGKAHEIAAQREELEADLVIVDHDLSPSQARNLERVIGGRVIAHGFLNKLAPVHLPYVASRKCVMEFYRDFYTQGMAKIRSLVSA